MAIRYFALIVCLIGMLIYRKETNDLCFFSFLAIINAILIAGAMN